MMAHIQMYMKLVPSKLVFSYAVLAHFPQQHIMMCKVPPFSQEMQSSKFIFWVAKNRDRSGLQNLGSAAQNGKVFAPETPIR